MEQNEIPSDTYPQLHADISNKKEGMFMSTRSLTNCILCQNHCLLNDLQCEKGIRYLERLKAKGKSLDIAIDYQPKSNNSGAKEVIAVEKKLHRIWEQRKHMEIFEERDDLFALMGRCGHVIYHKQGQNGGQGKILRILSERQVITQKELQYILHIQSGSISEIITKLEHKGYLTREKDENDKRIMILKITDEGMARVDMNAQLAKDNEIFQVLTSNEQDELKKLLEKLLVSWKED